MPRQSEGRVILVLGYLGYQGNFGKLGPSALIFQNLSNFLILSYRVLNFLSRMGSINFGSSGSRDITK